MMLRSNADIAGRSGRHRLMPSRPDQAGSANGVRGDGLLVAGSPSPAREPGHSQVGLPKRSGSVSGSTRQLTQSRSSVEWVPESPTRRLR